MTCDPVSTSVHFSHSIGVNPHPLYFTTTQGTCQKSGQLHSPLYPQSALLRADVSGLKAPIRLIRVIALSIRLAVFFEKRDTCSMVVVVHIISKFANWRAALCERHFLFRFHTYQGWDSMARRFYDKWFWDISKLPKIVQIYSLIWNRHADLRARIDYACNWFPLQASSP